MATNDVTQADMGELRDRLAIQDLLYHYAELVDLGNNQRIASEVFAPDAVLDFGGPTISGFEKVHDFYCNSPLFSKFPADLDGYRHDISNVRIRFDGPDTAQSAARVTAWHWHKSERAAGLTRPADLVITGLYQDDLVRLPMGWRIRRRRGGQFGTGIGAGKPLNGMEALFSSLLGRIPTWDGQWIDTPFLSDKAG